jgi:hypothetical protein
MATIEKYQLLSGATQYRVRYRTPDGRSTQKRGLGTKREAEQWANRIEVDKVTGRYIAPSVGKVTVGTLGPPWLDRQRGHMEPSGFRSYESAWRVHVAPAWALGALPVSSTPRFRRGARRWPPGRPLACRALLPRPAPDRTTPTAPARTSAGFSRRVARTTSPHRRIVMAHRAGPGRVSSVGRASPL